eukprot:COSAG04_NODE_2439_length_4122_cov_4.376336_2_plen_73_part_00
MNLESKQREKVEKAGGWRRGVAALRSEGESAGMAARNTIHKKAHHSATPVVQANQLFMKPAHHRLPGLRGTL